MRHQGQFYRKNKKFADGTVLVKEVFSTDDAKLPTGDTHWAKGTKHWFVMIKDEKGRFSGNPLWADGWGCALFKSDAPDKQVATDYKKDCLGCHIPAKGYRLDLRPGLSSSRHKVSATMRWKVILEMMEICDEEVFVAHLNCGGSGCCRLVAT